MLTVAELQQRVDELKRVYSEGRREVKHSDGRAVTYGGPAELRDVIASLEREISGMQTTPVTTVLVAASKGLE